MKVLCFHYFCVKNLKIYGVEPLNTQEMLEVNGGSWTGDVFRKVGGAIVSADEWGGVKAKDVWDSIEENVSVVKHTY